MSERQRIKLHQKATNFIKKLNIYPDQSRKTLRVYFRYLHFLESSIFKSSRILNQLNGKKYEQVIATFTQTVESSCSISAF